MIHLPLTEAEADRLRGKMDALLYLFGSQMLGARRLGCQLKSGGSLSVLDCGKGWVRLTLRVNRETAYAVSCQDKPREELIAYWWETFGKAMTEASR